MHAAALWSTRQTNAVRRRHLASVGCTAASASLVRMGACVRVHILPRDRPQPARPDGLIDHVREAPERPKMAELGAGRPPREGEVQEGEGGDNDGCGACHSAGEGRGDHQGAILRVGVFFPPGWGTSKILGAVRRSPAPQRRRKSSSPIASAADPVRVAVGASARCLSGAVSLSSSSSRWVASPLVGTVSVSIACKAAAVRFRLHFVC